MVGMSTRKLIEERRQKKKRQNTMMLLMMGAGLALVVAALVIAFISSNNVNISKRNINIPELTSVELSDFNGLGDPNAPVVIQEFSDFGCSHCADFALGTKKLIEENYIATGQVYLEFHSVGGLLNSPATFQAAEASYCAGDQNSLWPYHDLIFANQTRLFSNRTADISPTLESFAEILELDVEQFNTCLAEGKYLDLTASDQVLASSNGITGTPSFLINGTLLTGNQPYENFQQAIEQAILTNQ
jgi:protein-disulfide isomerase